VSARKSLRLLRKLGRALLLAFAALVIVLAIGVGGFRLLVTQLPGYQDELQAWVSDALGLTLRFDAVDARWGLAGPQLTLHGVSLGTGGAEVMLDAEEVDVGLSAVRFVFERTIAVDRLTISGTHFTVIHAADGSLRLRGVTAADQAGFSIDDLPAVRVLLRDSELSYVDEASGASWQLQAVQAELGREGESLTLAARAQARLALRDVSLPTLLPLFGNVPVVARQGHGDVSIWIDVSDGQPLRGTLEASIEDLGLTARAADGAVSSYDHVQVTGEWQRKERGWQLC
jgi:uncharacterized protein YhdP